MHAELRASGDRPASVHGEPTCRVVETKDRIRIAAVIEARSCRKYGTVPLGIRVARDRIRREDACNALGRAKTVLILGERHNLRALDR